VVRGSYGIVIKPLISHYKLTYTGSQSDTVDDWQEFLWQAPRVPFLSSLLSSHCRWSLLAPDFWIPTLVPTICELERTPTKCHPKWDLGRNFRPKAHPKRSEVKFSPPLKQPSKPHTYLKQPIHKAPWSNHRSQKTRGPSGTTNNPSGGVRHEHLNCDIPPLSKDG
jgi:hypothetical protein